MQHFAPVKRWREHFSPSLVISLVALFVALGGASYAAIKIPKNSVGTKQLKAKAVSGAKVKNGTLQASKLAAGVLPPGQGFFKERSPGLLLVLPDAPTFANLVSLDLPVGSYALSASATVVNFDPIDRAKFTCTLGSATVQSIGLGPTTDAVAAMPVTMTTAVKVTSSTETVSLACTNSDPGDGNPAAANVSIVAVPVKSIDGAPVLSP